MYLPEHFKETDNTQLFESMRLNPLGTLVTYSTELGLDANHIPFEVVNPSTDHPQGLLRAHIAKNNPLWKEIASGSEVLVIFKSTDNYISPNWYPSKHETHKQVPTWNYQVVHVKGTITFQDDEKTVRGIVARLTREHELRSNQAVPWKMTDSAPEFINDMLSKIIGVEIKISSITGKYKLGQNKSEADRLGAATALQTLNPNMANALFSTLIKK